MTVKGPKGELSQEINPAITVKEENGHIEVSRPNDERENRAMHGLYRALINNMVVGVSEGYKKEMELVGVGYRAQATGQVLELALGYSHAIFIKLPKEVKVEAKSERNKTRSSSSRAATSSSSARCARKYAPSAKPRTVQGKSVSSLLAKLSAASQESRLTPNKI